MAITTQTQLTPEQQRQETARKILLQTKRRNSRILQSQSEAPKKLTPQEQQRAALKLLAQRQQQKKDAAIKSPLPQLARRQNYTPVSSTVDTSLLNQGAKQKEEEEQTEQESQSPEEIEQQRAVQLIQEQQIAQQVQLQQETAQRATITPPQSSNLEYIAGRPTPVKFARDRGWTWLYGIQIGTIPAFGLFGLAYLGLVVAMLVAHTNYGKKVIGEFRGPAPYPFQSKIVGYLIVMALGFIWAAIYAIASIQTFTLLYIWTHPIEAARLFGDALIKFFTG